MMVWIDCEMTGLDLIHDALIEVAVLITDKELNVVGEGLDLLIPPSREALDRMNDFVRTMHTTSGLLDELESASLTMDQAEQQILDYVHSQITVEGKVPLAGNTISTDRAFIARDMPRFESFLHYRNIDVSSIKELVRRWYPRAFYQAPAKNGNHRALADIQESIEELRFYRDAFFVPQPGPTVNQAMKYAQARQGELTGFTAEISQ